MLDSATEEKARAELSEVEAEEVQELSKLRAAVVYEIVRREGDGELTRPFASLMWSGLAAGLAISFSVLMQAFLAAHLPDAEWARLVERIGYTSGFLLVILARLQLFTESTITAVLPICAAPSLTNFAAAGRLWGIVLAFNLIGTLLFTIFCLYASPNEAALRAFGEISAGIMEHGFGGTLVGGVFAGFLMASIVWIMPSAEGSEFWVILFLTYLIALGDFAHVVAGSGEAWFLVLTGAFDPLAVFSSYFVPCLIGNILGGTVLFTMLAYAQVAKEIKEKPAESRDEAGGGAAAKDRPRTSASRPRSRKSGRRAANSAR